MIYSKYQVAELINEKTKILNNINKGINLVMELSRLLRLRETLVSIQTKILLTYLKNNFISENDKETVHIIEDAIKDCNSRLNNLINETLVNKIKEEYNNYINQQFINKY